MNEAKHPATPCYTATELTMRGNCIIITCSDAEEASRAQQEAVSEGLDASTEKNQLILRYEVHELPP
ncbi:MAG: hypothetical protein ABG776_03460 [Cyanobacteria bacterium J06555_13]